MGHIHRSDRRGRTLRAKSVCISLAIGAALTGGEYTYAADAPGAGLEEIVVTARRREESLQETPIAISAFTAESLERQQIFSTDDLDQVSPNLQFAAYGPLTGHNSAAQVFIRGIGQTDGSSGVDPGVGLYIDEVYMGRAVGGIMDFRDIAGIQVLRGPQGTLFGRNTIGGAVLLTTALPGDELGGTVRVGVGDDDLREAFVAVDLPIADGLGARISAGARQRDGYVTRIHDNMDLGDEDSFTTQAVLRWETDPVTLTLRGDYTREDENGSPFVFAAINESQVFPIFASVAAGCSNGAGAPSFPPPVPVPQDLVDPRCANDATWNLGKYTNGGTAPAFSRLENWGTSLVAEFKLSDAFRLKSISAYRELNWHGARDADNTPLTILHTDYKSDGRQFSEELQGLVETDRLKGVFGLFYFDEKVTDFLQVPIAAGVGAPAQVLQGSRDYQLAYLDNENWAVFTQWTYDITDALSVTAGVRYTEETKGARIIGFTTAPVDAPTIVPDFLRPYTIDANGLIVQSNVIPPGHTSPGLHVHPDRFENDYSSTTGSASIQYKFAEKAMAYLSWSQGFKSGGFNQRFNSVTFDYTPLSFKEETAETIELGFKSDIAGVLRLNAAIFNTDYEDMQLIYRVGVVPILFNAGKATIRGGELEFTYAPGSLIIEGSVGYLDDEFDSITPIVVPGSQVTATVTPNNSLPFTPEWQANIGIGYDIVGPTVTLTPRVNISYTDSQFFDAANSREVAQLDDVTLVNVSLTLAFGDWKIRAGINNVTNKEYLVAGNSSTSTSAGYAEAIYSRPRNWFLTAQYEF
jgi:iron complex outermembrane receptor protein